MHIGHFKSSNFDSKHILETGSAAVIFFFCGTTASFEPRSPHLTFLDHTHTHTHTQIDESEILISLLQRVLPIQHTTNTRDEHPCPQQDSNP